MGTVHRKKGAHTDGKHGWHMREVTLLFVVEFWNIHGDLASKVGDYILLFTCVCVWQGDVKRQKQNKRRQWPLRGKGAQKSGKSGRVHHSYVK